MNPVQDVQKTATTQEIGDKIHPLVLEDSLIKVCEIEEAVGISSEQVIYILHNKYKLKKLSEKWMPHLLN